MITQGRRGLLLGIRDTRRRIPPAVFLSSLLALTTAGCSSSPPAEAGGKRGGADSDSATRGDATPGVPSAGDQPSGGDPGGSSPILDTGAQFLDSCTEFNSRCEDSTDPQCGKCEYRIQYNSRTCTKETPCDNLFLLWAADECGLTAVGNELTALAGENGDFVFLCIQPNYPGVGIPISLGAPERDSATINHAFERLKNASDIGVWSGKNVLMTGCSDGGSRYPVVAGRYPDDTNWVGSVKTAGCFGDGVVSITYQDEFTAECDPSPGHSRVITAYTRALPLAGHSCENSPGGQCPCDPGHTSIPRTGDCGGGDCVSFDSIIVRSGSEFVFNTGVSASSFAIDHWKLIADGSGWENTPERCSHDRVPAGPYRALCEALDGASDKTCAFVDAPNRSHCAYFRANLQAECIDWFRAL